MTNTVSIRADHLGSTQPVVNGHQYVVVGEVTISAYRTGTTATAASQNITADAAADDYVRVAGNFATDGFQAGDMVCVLGSHADNNDNVDRITSVTTTTIENDTIVMDAALIAEAGGGNETITHAGEKILASSFGLNTVYSVELVGQTSSEENWLVNTIAADGSYFHVVCMTTGSAGALLASMPTGALPPLTLRVTGSVGGNN